MRKLLLTVACAAGLWAQGSAQGVDTAMLLKRLGSSWPQHNGDYTGQRFSPLKQINTSNVGSLTRAWAFETRTAIKATTLMVDGVVYFSVPDNVWAARCAHGQGDLALLAHIVRRSPGQPRRHAVQEPDLFRHAGRAPDLARREDRREELGSRRRGLEIRLLHQRGAARRERQAAGRHVRRSARHAGFLEARDLNDGKLVWRWDAIPKPGEPGSETWPNKEVMAHGGGATWVQGVYDPQLNLTYWGTGNPHPVHAGNVRKGANLYTCSLVALDVDTGKMKWYIQTSPHDTHDRDANQTPILIDGRLSRTAAQAHRDGEPQRLLLPARPRDRRKPGHRAVRRAELVRRCGQARAADSQAEDVEPTVDGAFFEGTTTNW